MGFISGKKSINYSGTNRREFLKKKIVGAILLSAGAPVFALGKFFNQSAKPDIQESIWKDEDLTWEEIRELFLIESNVRYFNTGSLGPSPKTVVDRVCHSMSDLERNPATGRKLFEKTHQRIANYLRVQPNEIAITRNATEGMNIVARSLPLKEGDEVILTKHEHIGGSAPWLALQKELGIRIKLVELDLTGKDNLRLLKESISANTRVISFSHVTCTTGMRLPAKEIVALCRKHEIYSCIDGAQALGMIPINLGEIQPDFYTTSGHKWMFGPKGTGVLFMNKSVIAECKPVFVGAYTDSSFNLNEKKIEYRNTAQREEYGTRNTPLVLGLESAFELNEHIGIDKIAQRGQYLADYFRKGLMKLKQIEVLTPKDKNYSASIVTFRVGGLDNLTIPNQLFQEGRRIRVRGIYENDLNAIRVSFSMFNTIDEIDFLLNSLKEILQSNE